MIKYKGTNKVKVYWHEREYKPKGGDMIGSGSYLCVDRCVGWFQFDEECTFQGGEKRTVKRRVCNVRKSGIYKKNLLIGP